LLGEIIDATGLTSQSCADMLGISHDVFSEWIASQRAIPESYVPLLCDALGVEQSALMKPSKQSKAKGAADITPAIWYKFKGENLVTADRESVLLIRQLGHFQHQLEDAIGRRLVSWKPLFEGIWKEVDSQAPPGEQGRRAARLLRDLTGLSHGATGIGEVFRGNLRRHGLLVIESPIRESQVEGCSFYVGAHPDERPCVFANTHHTTWFRRNAVLMHEVGHAIFDAASAAASLDFRGFDHGIGISEQRAEAFALEALVPREVLYHAAQSNGIKWQQIDARGLAMLVAAVQIEQRMVVHAAVANGFLQEEEAQRCLDLDIHGDLKRLSERALTTSEFLERLPAERKNKLLISNRTVTVPSRPLRLPVPYVMTVVEAVRQKQISKGKAAELLMIDRRELESRFGDLVQGEED
jgi:Zn-dependent peptidase ImmA (M78 family)